MILPDQGYFFGMGAFETVAVENGRPVFLKEHYERLFHAMEFLHLERSAEELEEKVGRALDDPFMQTGRKVLKITVSEKNLLVTTRENTYEEKHYRKGFTADFSCVRRNETSPFTYHKTLNYGDCLREKHLAHERGVDEPVFLNTRGIIAEGASSNVFFVKKGEIFTPSVECGLLPGIMRDYICRTNQVREIEVYPEETETFEEMFLTNSLLGVMPVAALGNHRFPSRAVGQRLLEAYRNTVGY